MEFVWDDQDANIGCYRLRLIDNNEKLDEVRIVDYTCDFHKEYDRKNKFPRPYAFEVSYCQGWSMSQGFDYDKDYNNHDDGNGYHIGGYQGECTHTLEDIREWCENFIAQLYLQDYDKALKTLDIKKQRAEWFENEGFELGSDGRQSNEQER